MSLNITDGEVLDWTHVKENVQELGLASLLGFNSTKDTKDIAKTFPTEFKLMLEEAERAVSMVILRHPALNKEIQDVVDAKRHKEKIEKFFVMGCSKSHEECLSELEDEPPEMINVVYDGLIWRQVQRVIETLNTESSWVMGDDEIYAKHREEAFDETESLLEAWVAKVGAKNVYSFAMTCLLERTHGKNKITQQWLGLYSKYKIQPPRWTTAGVFSDFIFSRLQSLALWKYRGMIPEGAEILKNNIIAWCEQLGSPTDTGTPLDCKKLAPIDDFIEQEEIDQWKKIEALTPDEKRKHYEQRMMKHFGYVPTEKLADADRTHLLRTHLLRKSGYKR